MFNPRSLSDSERGQVAVLFALLLVAIVVMVGIVLDGGSAFAQRRAEQNASDFAALAGANTYLVTGSEASTVAAARANAAENGFEHGVDGVTVDVFLTVSNGASVRVDIEAPHRNHFGSIIGLPTWQVATTATALSGFPDTAEGAGPMIFNIEAFGTDGRPLPQYANPASPFAFHGMAGDAPEGQHEFTWTNYGTGNLDTDRVRRMIHGEEVVNKTLAFGEYIGQHNQGSHTALFHELQNHLTGQNLPVPVVDSAGTFQGWATFHVVSASGQGNPKVIRGYFVSPFVNDRLTVGAPSCGVAGCPAFLGSYVLKLID